MNTCKFLFFTLSLTIGLCNASSQTGRQAWQERCNNPELDNKAQVRWLRNRINDADSDIMARIEGLQQPDLSPEIRIGLMKNLDFYHNRHESYINLLNSITSGLNALK